MAETATEKKPETDGGSPPEDLAARPGGGEAATGQPRRSRARVPIASVDDRILFHEELSWKQIDELDRNRTVFFITVSPLDQHGPHLPVGVDCFGAQAFAAAAARRLCTEHPEWTAVLSPILPVGAQTFDYLGSVQIRRRVIRDLLADFGASLAAYDFKHIVVVNAHGAPGHLMAVKEACAWVNDRFDARMFSPMERILPRLFTNGYRDVLRQALGRNGTSLDLSGDHHAGHLETSVMLYLRPELVDDGYTGLKPVIVEAERIDESAARNLGDRLGYFGSPASADRDLGKVAVALVGKEVVDAFLRLQQEPALIEEYRPPLWSAQVVYRTDFMRWVLAVLVVLLLCATWALFL